MIEQYFHSSGSSGGLDGDLLVLLASSSAFGTDFSLTGGRELFLLAGGTTLLFLEAFEGSPILTAVGSILGGTEDL